MPVGSFTAGITAIRERARQKMGDGPVTSEFTEHTDDIVDLLGA